MIVIFNFNIITMTISKKIILVRDPACMGGMKNT